MEVTFLLNIYSWTKPIICTSIEYKSKFFKKKKGVFSSVLYIFFIVNQDIIYYQYRLNHLKFMLKLCLGRCPTGNVSRSHILDHQYLQPVSTIPSSSYSK